MTGRSNRARFASVAAATAMLVGGCAVARVDAPLTFTSDRRLKIVQPKGGAVVPLGVTVRWSARDFEPTGGKRFVVFVDRLPLKPGEELRLRVCTDGDKRPITPGEQRRPCKDDRETVAQTTKTRHTFDCIKPREFVSDRLRNEHTVAVFLLDAEGKREGTAGYSVRFKVKHDAHLDKCAGFGGA